MHHVSSRSGSLSDEIAAVQALIKSGRSVSVVSETRALPPVARDLDDRLIRAFGLANAVIAFTHLGYFEEAIEAFEESRWLRAEAGVSVVSLQIEILSLATSAMYVGADLREAVGDTDLGRSMGTTMLGHLRDAIILTAPGDRRLAAARTPRERCLGRYPAEESVFLAVLGFYAVADGDDERARDLSETVVSRTPATFTLKRHNLIRARGESLDLIAEQRHHQQALAAELADVDVGDLNRRKLHDELARRTVRRSREFVQT